MSGNISSTHPLDPFAAGTTRFLTVRLTGITVGSRQPVLTLAAVRSGEPALADTPAFDAAPPAVAVLGTAFSFAAGPGEALVANTLALHAQPPVAAVVGTSSVRAVGASESGVTHALSVDAAPPVVAVPEAGAL